MIDRPLDPQSEFFRAFGLVRDYQVGDLRGFRPSGYRMRGLVELQLQLEGERVLAAELLIARDLASQKPQSQLARDLAGAFLEQCFPRPPASITALLESEEWHDRPVELQADPLRLLIRTGKGLDDRLALLVLSPETTLCPSCERCTLVKSGKCGHCQASLGRSRWWKLGWKR